MHAREAICTLSGEIDLLEEPFDTPEEATRTLSKLARTLEEPADTPEEVARMPEERPDTPVEAG